MADDPIILYSQEGDSGGQDGQEGIQAAKRIREAPGGCAGLAAAPPAPLGAVLVCQAAGLEQQRAGGRACKRALAPSH